MKQPYNPQELPINIKNEEIIKLLHLENVAIKKISKFNTMLENSLIRERALSLFTMHESVQSTRIEGTQASFSEVIESDVTGYKNTDIMEVLNYQLALEKGQEILKTMPISTRMFHELHLILMRNVRGGNRNPGHYRDNQNFIGRTNNIKDATYIPPIASLVNQYMSNLERYINDEIVDSLGVLSRAAIIHAQFETIHPYYDGNGRLGRILIILYLLNKDVIQSINFFMSRELEKNKYQYYALLNGIRDNANPKWFAWVEFFIKCASNQADYYIDKLKRIEEVHGKLLRDTEDNKIKTSVAAAICTNPVFTINMIKGAANVSYETARKSILKLVELGHIYPDEKKRNKIYRHYELLDILRE